MLAEAIEDDSLNEVDPFFTSTASSNEERLARSAIHPTFMGGEYLPNLEEGEIEVARLDLRSVTADAISIRLRVLKDKFWYRVVDEYMDEYDNGLLGNLSGMVSDEPLSLGELSEFAVVASRIKDICDPDRFDSEQEAQEFVFASSEFYPEFGECVSAVISALYLQVEKMFTTRRTPNAS